MRPYVLIIASLFFSCTTLRANSSNITLKIKHRDKAVRIVFPESLTGESHYLAQHTADSLLIAERRTGLQLQDDAEIYFDPSPLSHNGITTVIPRDRIVIYIAPPFIDSNVGIYDDYLLETLTHEWAHLLSLQPRRGIFRISSWLLGNASRPNGTWPRWIHEGLAVWTEETLGARPRSGWIEISKKKYALKFKETGIHPLKSASLDGDVALNRTLKRVRPGEIPYSFGYALINKLVEKAGGLAAFVQKSSSSLGLSFRKTWKALGVDLDQTLEDLQKEWAATPVDSARESKMLRSGSDLLGPFPSGVGFTWIDYQYFEESRESRSVLNYSEEADVISSQLQWRFKLWRPIQAYKAEENFWIVLVEAPEHWFEHVFSNATSPVRRKLIFLSDKDRSTDDVCIFDLGEKLREVHLENDNLLWITESSDGYMELKGAQRDSGCKVKETQLLSKSNNAFQRLAMPTGNLSHWNVTKHLDEKNLQEGLINESGLTLQSVPSNRLDVFYKFHRRDNSRYAIVTLQQSKYWGPLLLDFENANQARGYKLPIRTQGSAALLSRDEKFVFYKESLWDHDEIRQVSIADIKKQNDFTSIRWTPQDTNSADNSAVRATVENPVEVDEAKKYSASSTIWPKFWIPSLASSNNAFVFVGQTFYSDITEKWSGATLLGYNSNTKRPLATTLLQWSPPISKRWGHPSLYAEYNPKDISYLGFGNASVQENVLAQYSHSWPFTLEAKWSGSLSLGVQYQYDGAIGDYSETTDWIPSFRLKIGSYGAVHPYDSTAPLSQQIPYLYVSSELRWLRAPELNGSAFALLKTSKNSRFLIGVEGAATDISNFPSSYFVWGGLSPFTPAASSYYLNRGFPVSNFAAEDLLRFTTEWIVSLSKQESALSWNRLRVRSLDLRIIGESITWSSFFSPNFRVGHQYASSAGFELDFGGSALHYVNYRLSLGAFKGFGLRESFQIVTQLRTNLNL